MLILLLTNKLNDDTIADILCIFVMYLKSSKYLRELYMKARYEFNLKFFHAFKKLFDGTTKAGELQQIIDTVLDYQSRSRVHQSDLFTELKVDGKDKLSVVYGKAIDDLNNMLDQPVSKSMDFIIKATEIVSNDNSQKSQNAITYQAFIRSMLTLIELEIDKNKQQLFNYNATNLDSDDEGFKDEDDNEAAIDSTIAWRPTVSACTIIPGVGVASVGTALLAHAHFAILLGLQLPPAVLMTMAVVGTLLMAYGIYLAIQSCSRQHRPEEQLAVSRTNQGIFSFNRYSTSEGSIEKKPTPYVYGDSVTL